MHIKQYNSFGKRGRTRGYPEGTGMFPKTAVLELSLDLRGIALVHKWDGTHSAQGTRTHGRTGRCRRRALDMVRRRRSSAMTQLRGLASGRRLRPAVTTHTG